MFIDSCSVKNENVSLAPRENTAAVDDTRTAGDPAAEAAEHEQRVLECIARLVHSMVEACVTQEVGMDDALEIWQKLSRKGESPFPSVHSLIRGITRAVRNHVAWHVWEGRSPNDTGGSLTEMSVNVSGKKITRLVRQVINIGRKRSVKRFLAFLKQLEEREV